MFCIIERVESPFSDEESLAVLNRYVREWFVGNFDELTPPQRYAFKLIAERRNTLIASPTGTGKTMSGFLSILSTLFDKAVNGTLEERVYCIYVSPLRSLNNDVYKNLTEPLEGIYQIIKEDKGVDILKDNIRNVTIAVRTGDTTQKERRRMLAKPPNILVTTPESLAILISSSKFVENMRGVEYVVIDEIHELANNKRGTHLSLSIERLQSIVGRDIVRIGLGATLHPMEEAARFLVGMDGDEPRSCAVVDTSLIKSMEVSAISPVKDMIYTPEQRIEAAMYKEIGRIVKMSKTTLIFTNTRSGTERVVFNMKRRLKYKPEDIAAHHSSLSRESRLEVEGLLKQGALRCVVSSTSLELGVDIGTIDNVIQLGSPKSVTRALQRIGRAGHTYQAVAKGEMIVLNRDDLVECTVMLDAAMKKHLDSFSVSKNALDVLAQHIVGMAIDRKWEVDEMYNVIRHAYPYATLSKEDFMAMIDYLAGNYVGLESRRVYGKIWYDKETGIIGRRGMAIRPIYMLNLGTIPDEVAINVLELKTKRWIGNIEEEFLSRLEKGDIFSLGGKLYMFSYTAGSKCYVSEAKSSAPTIPPWFSEQLPLSFELAERIGEFRAAFAESLMEMDEGEARRLISQPSIKSIPKSAKAILDALPVNEYGRIAIFRYFTEQLLFAGEVPNNRYILIEYTRDKMADTNYIIFHSLFGRRVNDTLSRVVAISLGAMLGQDISITINDNGFVVNTEEETEINEDTISTLMKRVVAADIDVLLKGNIRNTEIMRRRFRHVATRSFMILKNYMGRKMSVNRQQMNSRFLLKALEEIDPDFPILKETYREIFEEVMDIGRTRDLIGRIERGEVRYKFIETRSPSPFAHTILTFGHADVVLMKERNDYLRYLHGLVLKRIGVKGRKGRG